jgi:alkylation response protein AidB-like acyl-CoA dehydrogenase
MDFGLSDTQQEISGLAARVLEGARPVPVAAHPAMAAGAALDGGWDGALWKELAQAGLLALTLPEWLGGDGLGPAEAAVLLTETGRRGAAVPVLATLMTGVLPVARWAGRGLQETVLAGVATGATVLTAAVREPSQPMPMIPATTAVLTDGGGTVSGVKTGVPYGTEADWVLVPASAGPRGTVVVVVSPAADGVTVHPAHSSGGEPECTLRLDAAPIAGVLGGAAGGQAVADLYELAVAGACSLADGAVAAALALTTGHIGTRQQFGRPLATFQAAAQHIADVYITARTLHLATLSACWRLGSGLDAGPDLDVAAYWLAEHAPAAMRACHHLHGGTGMDVSYPLPRLSAMVKDLARYTGGTSFRLDRLEARMDLGDPGNPGDPGAPVEGASGAH